MRLALALAATFVVIPTAAAAPPRNGVLVPGERLGGLALGAAPAQVRAAWGPRHGTCRGCRAPTWYFNFKRFEPEGAGVTFRSGRTVALFTVWAPKAWRTNRGLTIGDDASRAMTLYRGLVRITCGTYYALTLNHANAVTSVYVHDEKVWGFGLSRPREAVCR